MGGSSTKFITPTGIKKEGSALAEIRIAHIRDAHEIIGMTPSDYTPVILRPNRYASTCCGCPCCCVSVPAGFTALVSKWGQDIEGDQDSTGWEPGFHCLSPWYRVNRLVSKQLIIFDAPVQACKTQDHISVTIDIIIVFEITNARDFAYKLGPQNLDDLLRASQEEVVRQMAAATEVEKIYDLAGNVAQDWVAGMNSKFQPYGVTIHHFTVRNVRLPQEMAQDFEDKTLYESKTLEKQMLQESNKMKLSNDEEQQKLREECDNAKMAAEEQAVTAKAQLTKEVREVESCTEKELQIVEAQRNGNVQDLNAKAELEHETLKAEILQIKRKVECELESEAGKKEASSEAYVLKKAAAGKAESSKMIAEGHKAVAKAEGAATYAFASRRAMEQEQKRLEIVARLAENAKVQVVTSHENATGLAPNNSIVAQVVQQGMEALRIKMAEMTAGSARGLEMGRSMQGGIVRAAPTQPQQQLMV